jgi:hypothetical protein
MEKRRLSDDGGPPCLVLGGLGTITLTATLPTLTKSVTIEGNGLTLTRASSWTASSATSQLLYINSTTAVVSISRVYFKDGLATDYGAAIRNTGTLTLESCIFSGNTTTISGAWGGAIYSAGNTTIKGSTFYNNTTTNTSGKSGAIYFEAANKTLSLTGNLFYGNSAPQRSVVYVYSGTATSGGYNVSDKATGVDNTNGSGWTFGTGDIQVTEASIDTTSIKPLSAKLSALQIVPTSTDGFPAADFSGAARTVSGGMTAGGAWSTAQ